MQTTTHNATISDTELSAGEVRSVAKESTKVRIKSLKPSDLPAPPQAAARIIQACSDSDISAQQLAKIVASDPVLTAELLRTVNSAFFGLSREVKTAGHAVTVLGNRALRNLALCLAVRDALGPESIPGFDMTDFWEDALRRAVAAKILGKAVGFDPDEAFTIGLLQDFGMLALLCAVPSKSHLFTAMRQMMPEDRRQHEQQHFGITHDKVGLMLARKWALPAGLALPMACHHSLDAEGLPEHHRMACRIALCADLMSAVFSAEDKKTALERCRVVVGDQTSLPVEKIDALLDAIPSNVEDAAQSLGLRVQEQCDFEHIMREANRRLVRENMSYQELTWRLQRALDEKERLAAKLQEANESLEQLAYYDALTGLVNRRRFYEVLPAEIARHSRNGKSLSVVMIDLDHFKSINDNYGHPFGDTVLEKVAQALRDALRRTDIKARVGGEEICILLPETDAENAKNSLERVRAAIEGLQLRAPTRVVPVTASFGGCTWSGRALDRDSIQTVVKTLIKTADLGLYDAKHAGRNQICWRPYGGGG
ncbi:MAG: diguanylate cyclase (GGDEF)-like protein [Myxococcota bacterium]